MVVFGKCESFLTNSVESLAGLVIYVSYGISHSLMAKSELAEEKNFVDDGATPAFVIPPDSRELKARKI